MDWSYTRGHATGSRFAKLEISHIPLAKYSSLVHKHFFKDFIKLAHLASISSVLDWFNLLMMEKDMGISELRERLCFVKEIFFCLTTVRTLYNPERNLARKYLKATETTF